MLFGRFSIIITGKSKTNRFRQTMFLLGIYAFIFLQFSSNAFAAIGCTLSNPAEDLKYLFPDMTSYKEDLKEFGKIKDGQSLYKDLRDRLGSDLDPIYEGFETPYTVYTVFKNQEKVGIVHGVNVPGKGGVIQIFLSVDPNSAIIKKFFFQRLESPSADFLRSKDFRIQFEKLSLADFYKHDYFTKSGAPSTKDLIANIKIPNMDTDRKADVEASLRGVRKNLILMDFFVFNRKFEPFYEKAKQSLAGKRSGS